MILKFENEMKYLCGYLDLLIKNLKKCKFQQKKSDM